jgi:hypothetical protein
MTTIDTDNERALSLWSRWREQKDAWHRLADSPQGTEEALKAGYDRILALEHNLQEDMRVGSVLALAAVLMIEQKDDWPDSEEVSGLRLASLQAIRPQLVGAIAEDADRVLAIAKEEEGA